MAKSDVFKANPGMKSYFETSDGQKFYKETDAHAYARKLKDRKVTEVTKPAKAQKQAPAPQND